MDQRPRRPASAAALDTDAQGNQGHHTHSDMDIDLSDPNSGGGSSTGQDTVAHTLDSLLGVGVVDQEVLERDIIDKANKAMDAKESEMDKKRLEKTRKSINKLQLEIRKLENNRKKLNRGSVALTNLEDKLEGLAEDLRQLETDEQDILDRIRARKSGQPVSAPSQSSGTSAPEMSVGQLEGESQREFLIRTGKITPFASMSGLEKSGQHGWKSSASSSTSSSIPSSSGFRLVGNATGDSPKSHIKLRRPSWSLIGKETQIKQDSSQDPWGLVTTERASKRKALARITKVKVKEEDDKSLIGHIKDEEMDDLVQSEDEHKVKIKLEDDYKVKIKPEDEQKVKIKLEEPDLSHWSRGDEDFKSELKDEEIDTKHLAYSDDEYKSELKDEKIDIKHLAYSDDEYKPELKDEKIDIKHLAYSDDEYKPELKDEKVDIKHLAHSDDEYKSEFKDEESDEADLSHSDDEYKPEFKDEDYSEVMDASEDDDYKIGDDYDDPELETKPKRERSERGIGGGAAYKFLCEDDGDETHYQIRLADWAQKRRHLRWRVNHPTSSMETDMNESWNDPEQKLDPAIEMMTPHPTLPDAELEGGFRIPGDIYSNLFDYQKTCAQWLWELHCQSAGGIIGDEMGLGKTIQVISFLAGLHYSGKLDAPAIIVCPATLLKQWVKEFHRWWPPMRVAILHSSGSGMHSRNGQLKEEDDSEGISDFLDDDSLSDDHRSGKGSKRRKAKGKGKAKKSSGGYSKRRSSGRGGLDGEGEGFEGSAASDLVDRISLNGHILVTTYAGLRIHAPLLLRKAWSYIILDEGHKIRNPDAAITLTCKQFRTPHRIILSGTPIQNNLNELWSLFDFVFPGRLGTLPVFQSQFAIPINLGGYANASNIQVQTAYKCAVVLRDLINPYLLRRMKADVASDMPKKSEQVLFCKLTPAQRKSYEDFIKSDALTSIMERKRHALYGIDLVRKICNHPDILNRDPREKQRKASRNNAGSSSSNSGPSNGDPNVEEEDDYGDYRKSGKMVVVKALLELWKKEKHRVLLFSQTRTMLDILEKFVRKEEYEYRRMDGTTPIQNRMGLVDEFNARDDIYVFLLTTKVGGLGVNLTGADRVIIFDPDWNPSTDVQARERAWRLGQTKAVTIYRLMTSGTIEEKIYHRQIFKQFLTNKILKDPKQKRFFKSHDMADLFKLEAEDAVGTETGGIFRGSELVVKKKASSKSKGSSSERSGGRSRSSRRGGDNMEEIERMAGVRKVEKFRSADQDREGMEDSLPGGIYGSGREAQADEDEDQGLSFKPKGEASSSTGSKDKQPEGTETDILKSLFEMSGVHSALRHDEIMDSAKQEHLIVEREATRVAERAMAALKESRKRRRRQDLDIPTWTGKSGLAGAPRTFVEQQQQGKKPRFGTANTFNSSVSARLIGENGKSSGGFGSTPGIGAMGSAPASSSSSSLLAGMLERKRLEHGGGSGNAGSATTTSSQSSSPRIESLSITNDVSKSPALLREGTREHLITRIRDFMLDHGGRVQSSALVEHFQDRLNEEEQVVFKKMLRGIALLEKDEHSSQRWWKLKADYY